MTTVLVLQGPNLNLVGTREPEIYGHESLDEIHAGIAARAAELGLDVDFFQSNHEGALIDRLHRRDFDVAIVNAGGLTHTSVALRDALLGVAAAVHRGPPVGSGPARAVPPGQLPPRRRARIDRRAGRARLPPGARVDRPPLRGRRWLTGAAARSRRPSCDACAGGSTRSTGGSSRCSTSAPISPARPGGPRRAAGRRAIRDAEREREVLLRVTMANGGPLPQADLLAVYRRLMTATRELETRDRARTEARDRDDA